MMLTALLLQIVTENGGTVSVETPILKESLTYWQAAHVQEWRLGNELLWGVTGDLELDFSAPLSIKHVRFGGVSKTLFGPGDASVRAKYSFLKEDQVMKSTRVAGLLGVEFPTGDARESEDGVALPRKLLLGSGSWDGWIGAVFTHIDDRHRFSADAIYRHNTAHDGFRLGDSYALDLAYWYRLHPAAFDPQEPTTEVRGVVEILTTYTEPSQAGGSLRDQGWILRVAPGLQVYPSRSVLLEMNVQVPLYQDVHDVIGHRDYAAFFAVKFLF
jgi:hypothetical protein